MSKTVVKIARGFYQRLAKPIFFNFNPEAVHTHVVRLGEKWGSRPFFQRRAARYFDVKDPVLRQTVNGVTFSNPIGLAAGFDYEARLTQVLPGMGFGFQSIGSITAKPCAGNPSPQLGRLPRSRSLMVNKGFRNLGIGETLKKLQGLSFARPVGISVGRTNNSQTTSLEASVEDIVASFKAIEVSSVPFSYYELNISCPNLGKGASFYEAKNLSLLLQRIDSLRPSKPLYIKMPISQPDQVVQSILAVATQHKVSGVIIGNVQTDRSVPSLLPEEVAKFSMGNFSGKPTQESSDYLIDLAYRQVGQKLTIIGCGGVFNAEDAYRKIRRGASLVQLITGLIYEGPQVVAEINADLVKLLKRDGFKNISAAVGCDTRPK